MNNRTTTASPYRCHLDWGKRGALQAAERGEVLVIVDTLSFSTAVVTAVHHGGLIRPCLWGEDPAELARKIGAEAAVHRAEVPEKGRYSLCPLTYVGLKADTRIVLASPNGATCSQCAQDAPHLFLGALVNAKAVAMAVSDILDRTDLCVTVIACGERTSSRSDDEAIRFAVEDYLGAGAIFSYLQCEKSPEARVCESAFVHNQESIEEIFWNCESGREFRGSSFEKDVEFAAQLNVFDCIPVLRDGFFYRL